MLIRAIAAFVALPGVVAFAVPIAIGIFTGLPVQSVTLAAVPLGLGMLLLLWCVLWGSRTLVIYAALFLCGFHLRVLLFEEPWAPRQFGAQWHT